MGYQEHLRSAGSIVVRCAVITLSDTRTEATDTTGAKIKSLLSADGQQITDYSLIPDEPAVLDKLLNDILLRADIDAILTNGGTGISPRDQTIPVIEHRIEIPIPGFGELFRALSFQEIGSGAMLSRAIAGISAGKLIFAMPGSTTAAELAMKRLILPELRHLVALIRPRGPASPS